MSMKFSSRPGVLLALALLICISLGGCLECKESITGRYDDQQDQFVFLNTYQRIGGQKAEDFDYLQTLWNNRDHLITPPIPTILSKSSFLRISNDKFAALSLGEAKKLEIEHSPLPLDQIKVEPGRFFLRGKSALCYFDQIVIPGAFVDESLMIASRLAREKLAKEVEIESSRRKGGGKVFSWESARIAAMAAIRKLSGPDAAPVDDGAVESPESLLNLVSDESLVLLESAFKDVSNVITRERATFQISVPLAEKDAAEIMKLVSTVRTAVADGLKKPGHDVDLEIENLLLQAYELHANSRGLAMSIRLIDVYSQLTQVMDPLAELPAPADETTAMRYTNAVAAMKSKNIPIDSTLTIQQILNDFQARRLKTYPPGKSVAPGDGFEKGDDVKR